MRAHIDDFGTGYSSLTFLHHFAGDTLKIDRSFVGVDAATTTAAPRSCARSSPSRTTSACDVIAEGVETSDSCAGSEELGCDYAQGFLSAGRSTRPRRSGWRAPGAPRTTV